MKVTIVGAGEAQDPNYINSALVVEESDFALLIDCGYAIPQALWRLYPDPDSIDAIYFTHHHADHCFGIVPVLSNWKDEGRRKPLPIFTTKAGAKRLLRLLDLGFCLPQNLSYMVEFRDIAECSQIGPYTAQFARTQHSIINYSIRLDANGIGFGYSGDGCPTQATRRLFDKVTALAHECYAVKPVAEPRYHCDLETCLDFAQKTHVRDLYLIHPQKNARAEIAQLTTGTKVKLLAAGDIFDIR